MVNTNTTKYERCQRSSSLNRWLELKCVLCCCCSISYDGIQCALCASVLRFLSQSVLYMCTTLNRLLCSARDAQNN